MSIRSHNKALQCPDCDSYDVKPTSVMSFPEWGVKTRSKDIKKKYHCESCGLEFEAPSQQEQQEMQNGMTLIIVVAIMIVMLLIVLL